MRVAGEIFPDIGQGIGSDRKGGIDSRHTLKIDAFGRSFSLLLESNDRLHEVRKQTGASAVALRGELEGKPGSWVRLTQAGARVSGMLWDGAELYAIEPASELSAMAATEGVSGIVIFRLADTVTDLGEVSCDTTDHPISAAKFYRDLRNEFKASEQTPVSHRLKLSTLMDGQFVDRYSSAAAAADAAIARLNNIDGIFSAQIGLTVEFEGLNPSSNSAVAPLSSSTSANELLQSLGLARASSSALYSTGTTHLFTGRDLDGNTIGLAYIGAVCDQRYGASLSESRDRGTWLDSLVAAHELGHSFGAVHDGTGECASTTPAFLMAPSIAGWDQFSQCSVDRIHATMSQATCLTPLPRGDIAVAQYLSERSAVPGAFTWSLDVSNVGEADIGSGMVSIAVPSAIRVEMAAASNSSCTFGGGIVQCELHSLAMGESRPVVVTMSGAQEGRYDVSATVTALGDANMGNNAGAGSIVIATAVTSPPPTQQSTAGGATSSASESAGGAVPVWMMGLLLLLGLRRNRR